jgi:hypothetical protein
MPLWPCSTSSFMGQPSVDTTGTPGVLQVTESKIHAVHGDTGAKAARARPAPKMLIMYRDAFHEILFENPVL